MKTNAMYALLAILTTFFMACEKESFRITPSGDLSSQQHAISDFSELDIAGPFSAQVTFSPGAPQLRIEANNNLHAQIRVIQDAGTLRIKLKDGTNISEGNLVLKVFVTVDELQAIKAQGTAQVDLQNTWDQSRPEIELDGASQLSGTILADQLTADLNGASELHLNGQTDKFEIEARGACRMDGFEFSTNDCTADLTGGSEISLSVNQQLSVQAEGASTVYYQGNGIIQDQQLSGGSQIVKM